MENQCRPLISIQRKPDVKFHSNGMIDISSNVTKTLGLDNGDVINILCSGFGEYYLYPAMKKSKCRVPNAKFANSVKSTKGNSNNLRCCCKQLTDAVAELTGSKESWLFVGNPRDLTDLGVKAVGVPLIYRNNQYKPNPTPD